MLDFLLPPLSWLTEAPLLGIALWFDYVLALPLVLAVSFVYAGTRHEWMGPILSHGVKLSLLLLLALGVALGVTSALAAAL